MALTAAEIITLSEITDESIASVEAKVVGISSDLETKLKAEVVLWNDNRDGVDVRLAGKVNLDAQNLLDAITDRVRNWLGWEAFRQRGAATLPGTVVMQTETGW